MYTFESMCEDTVSEIQPSKERLVTKYFYLFSDTAWHIKVKFKLEHTQLMQWAFILFVTCVVKGSQRNTT